MSIYLRLLPPAYLFGALATCHDGYYPKATILIEQITYILFFFVWLFLFLCPLIWFGLPGGAARQY